MIRSLRDELKMIKDGRAEVNRMALARREAVRYVQHRKQYYESLAQFTDESFSKKLKETALNEWTMDSTATYTVEHRDTIPEEEVARDIALVMRPYGLEYKTEKVSNGTDIIITW